MAETLDAKAVGVGSCSASEPTRIALSCLLDAWEEGLENGVAPEMMAYAALYAALSDLVGCFGEEAVASLAESLGTRVRKGEFTLFATVQ